LHVGGSLLGSRGNNAGRLLGTFRGGRQRARGDLQLARGRRHDFDDLADHRFEVAGNSVHTLPALDLCVRLHPCRLVGGFLGDEGLLEDLERTRHRTDFIGAIDRRDRHVMSAGGQVADDLSEAPKGDDDAAAQHHGDAGEHGKQHDDGEACQCKHDQGPSRAVAARSAASASAASRTARKL